MKKIVLILSFVLCTAISGYGQEAFFTDSLRKELTQLLVDKNIAIHTNMQNYDPLIIHNLLDTGNSTLRDGKFGLYDFRSEKQVLAYSLILMRNDNDYEILDIVHMNRSGIKTELKGYFRRHPETPKELFPLYFDALNRVRKAYSRLEKAWGIRLEKDGNNDLIYRFVSADGNPIEFEEIID